MTYARFLLVFLVPPVLGLGWLAVRMAGGPAGRHLLWELPLIALIAIVYTAPWDGSLITQGVWSYPADQVAGPTVLRVPLEEYGFYVLQVLLTGLVTVVAWHRLER
ncbi:MAG: lycopene cyclase domain-containing protein [Candidatus Dormibacteria bacterium]